jgi:hypothetical protein
MLYPLSYGGSLTQKEYQSRPPLVTPLSRLMLWWPAVRS